jgi:hypothetical protein
LFYTCQNFTNIKKSKGFTGSFNKILENKKKKEYKKRKGGSANLP